MGYKGYNESSGKVDMFFFVVFLLTEIADVGRVTLPLHKGKAQHSLHYKLCICTIEDPHS